MSDRKVEIYDELMREIKEIEEKDATNLAKISMMSNAARHAYLRHKGERK